MKIRIMANLKIHRHYDVELSLCRESDGAVVYQVEYGNECKTFEHDDVAIAYWKECAEHAMRAAWAI